MFQKKIKVFAIKDCKMEMKFVASSVVKYTCNGVLVILGLYMKSCSVEPILRFAPTYVLGPVFPQNSCSDFLYLTVSFKSDQHSGHINWPRLLLPTGVRLAPVNEESASLAGSPDVIHFSIENL